MVIVLVVILDKTLEQSEIVIILSKCLCYYQWW